MRPRPLCAWVLEPAHRLCQAPVAYLAADGRRYCGRHARRLAADGTEIAGRLLRPRRELYGRQTALQGDAISLTRWIGTAIDNQFGRGATARPTEVLNAMALTIEAKSGAQRISPEEQVKPGVYEARVASVSSFMGTKFNSEEPQLKVLLVFEVVKGKQTGKKADMIVTASLNEKATLYGIVKALTGIAAVPGQSYDVEELLTDRVGQIVVTPRPGTAFVQIESVVPLAGDDEDDDDLADA